MMMADYTDPMSHVIGTWIGGFGTTAILFRLGLALLLGAVIGMERSSKRHAAGFRTFTLVIFSGVCAMVLDEFISFGEGMDIHLLSAAFLLALSNISIHTVFHSSRNEIKGLTTAAALWTSGLIGLMLGAGLYTISLTAFAVLMCILYMLPAFEVYLKNRSNHFEIHLELKDSIYLQDFVTTIRKLGLSIDEIERNMAYSKSGLSVYSIAISISSEQLKKYKTHKEIIEALGTLDYIYYIEEMV